MRPLPRDFWRKASLYPLASAISRLQKISFRSTRALLVVLHFIVWPGMLDRPSACIGSRGGSSVEPRWILVAAVGWLVGGGSLVARMRLVGAR